MAKRDYYDILGVPKNASDDDIKKAYRKLAMKHHPDRNQGDKTATAEDKFKEAKEAYEMLSDPQKKQAYDQFGHAGVDPNMRGGPGQEGFGGFAEAFGDIFGDIFGGQQPQRRGAGGAQQVYRGNDLSYGLEISLEEAASGKDTQVRIPSWDACAACTGTGAKPGTKAQTCPMCHGQGTVHQRQGFFSIQQSCPQCRGTGKHIPDPCVTCSGAGRVKTHKTLEVKIPAGISEGMRIRSTGNGEPGTNGGPAGDLYIEVRVKQHELFERDGDDLHCTVPVGVTTCALGGKVQVPTLSGQAEIEVPEGTQHGKTFRLRGKGIKGLRSSYPGDLYAHVTVETPIKLNDQQRKLFQELDASLRAGGVKHSPNGPSWADKVKNIFKG